MDRNWQTAYLQKLHIPDYLPSILAISLSSFTSFLGLNPCPVFCFFTLGQSVFPSLFCHIYLLPPFLFNCHF